MEALPSFLPQPSPLLLDGYRLMVTVLRTIRLCFYLFLFGTVIITLAGIGVGIYAGTKSPPGWAVLAVFLVFGFGFGFVLWMCSDAIKLVEFILEALLTDWSAWTEARKQAMVDRMAPYIDSTHRTALVSRVMTADENALQYIIDWVIELIMSQVRKLLFTPPLLLFVVAIVLLPVGVVYADDPSEGRKAAGIASLVMGSLSLAVCALCVFGSLCVYCVIAGQTAAMVDEVKKSYRTHKQTQAARLQQHAAAVTTFTPFSKSSGTLNANTTTPMVPVGSTTSTMDKFGAHSINIAPSAPPPVFLP